MKSIVIKNISRNPVHNIQVNPVRNWQINPVRNWQINPARNWQINPVRNWQINPVRNWQINPTRNMQIDPHRNIILNPIYSQDIPGYYVWSVADSKCLYFTVKALTQNVFLFFDADQTFCFFAVGALDCYAVYTAADMKYVGSLCPNGAGRFNWFSQDGKWQFFLTRF